MNNNTIHTFELAGLGSAPFAITKNDPSNHSFFCAHCGHILTNRFFVKSADNKVSVVGIDCLKKTDDEGLLAGVKKLQREERMLAKHAKMEKNRQHSIQCQQEKNGGESNVELAHRIEVFMTEKKEQYQDALSSDSIITTLSATEFERNMQAQALAIKPFSQGQLDAIVRIITKKRSNNAKSNSSIYKSNLTLTIADVATTQYKLQQMAEALDLLTMEWRSILNGW